MYWALGLEEGGTSGSRPRRERWVGVRGMSARASGFLTRGRRAVPML